MNTQNSRLKYIHFSVINKCIKLQACLWIDLQETQLYTYTLCNSSLDIMLHSFWNSPSLAVSTHCTQLTLKKYLGHFFLNRKHSQTIQSVLKHCCPKKVFYYFKLWETSLCWCHCYQIVNKITHEISKYIFLNNAISKMKNCILMKQITHNWFTIIKNFATHCLHNKFIF